MEGRRADAQPSEQQERVVLRRVDLEQPHLRHPAQEADVGGGMENERVWRWVLNSPRAHDILNTPRAHVRLAPEHWYEDASEDMWTGHLGLWTRHFQMLR